MFKMLEDMHTNLQQEIAVRKSKFIFKILGRKGHPRSNRADSAKVAGAYLQ